MTSLVRDANAVLEHLQKQAEAEQKMLTGAVVFMVVCVIVLVVLFMNHATWRKYSMSRISDGDSINLAVAKLRHNISNHTELVNILSVLRKKLHNSPNAALEAARGGLSTYLLQCVNNSSHDDEKIPIVMSLINELWSVPAVRQYEHQQNNVKFLTVVDGIISLYRRLFESSQKLTEEYDQEADETSSFFSKKKKKITFDSYEHKFIMALGMACIDSTKLQSRVGDKGGIDCIIDSLENSPSSSKIVKWSCWSLVNLCITHPPNKRYFVQRGGIPLVLKGLNNFPKDEDLNYQGFAVLYSLLADDPQTKVNLSDCRQMALANGIVDLCQNCQKQFRQNKGLQGLTASVLDILVTEYS